MAREQPYALGFGDEGAEGVLEILTGPPPEGLNSVVVEVAHAVRQLVPGPVVGLFVNPAISGFFNGYYRFLCDSLASPDSPVRRVALVSSGVGLSGAKAALAALLRLQELGKTLEIHLFYGIRDVKDLAYKALPLTSMFSFNETRAQFLQFFRTNWKTGSWLASSGSLFSSQALQP